VRLSGQATSLEAKLIKALSHRVQAPNIVPKTTFDSWDDAYADAMRDVYWDYRESLDVAALFIEAMMTRTPWRMWDVNTKFPPRGADTLEALGVCEAAITQADQQLVPQHSAILHFHIHLLEMSETPERAMPSAIRLAGLCPDAGHIHHMPGHIFLLCGEYEKACVASQAAIEVNRKYLAYAGPYNYYTTARCHDLHLMMYSAMLSGQFIPAMAAAEEICENLTPDVIDLKSKPFIAATMEGYFSMKMHVLVRFGRWQEIVDSPMPENAALYCVSTAMHNYASAIAHATLGNIAQAEQQKTAFYLALEHIKPGRKFFNNPALTTLAVGEMMMLGELEYHKGNYPLAFTHLRESVRRCDNLHYSEPWPWMHPPRHALGALLLEQGHYVEAEEVYRSDLGLNDTVQRCAQHWENIWSLHGLAECLKHQGAIVELAQLQPKLDVARALADTPVTSSCCCRKMTADQNV
jgi:tetratricopeptide (TPR) repeat protein